MDSLIFAINAIAPIVIMVAIGYFLKVKKIVGDSFIKTANKLVFRLFLPAMLFLNVYKIENIAEMDFSFVFYASSMLVVIFLIALPLVITLTKDSTRRGVLLQGSFRSNYALVGIPLADSLFGDAGVLITTLLSAVFIPMLNILAVISLSIFSEKHKPNIKKILLDIAKNPLIESIVLGLFALLVRSIFVKNSIDFRISEIAPIFTTLEYLSRVATPIALVALGAQFEFSAVAELKKEIIFGTVMRTVVAPCLGIGIAYFVFGDIFGGAHFAAFVAAFATPVAVSSVPMAQEMDGDAVLAGQLVVFATLFSTVSIFLSSYLLKLAGVF